MWQVEEGGSSTHLFRLLPTLLYIQFILCFSTKKKLIFNIYCIPFHVKITPHSSYIFLTSAVFKLEPRKKKRQRANVFGRLAAQTTNLKKTTRCNRSREKIKLCLTEKHNH